MPTITKAQLEALTMLETAPRETTKYTRHDYVSGATMKVLVDRGWAELDLDWRVPLDPTLPLPPRRFRLTTEGKSALIKHRKATSESPGRQRKTTQKRR